MIARTALSALISFIIALSIVSAFLFFSQYKLVNGTAILKGDDTFQSAQEYFLSHPPSADENRVFVVGSSQVVAVNTTYVDRYLSDHGYDNYRVYNLASNSDQPKERLKTLDLIIAAKPKVVVYGVGPRDFQAATAESSLKVANGLPDPEEMLHSSLSKSGPDLDFMSSPKVTVLQTIKTALNEEDASWEPYPDIFAKAREENGKAMADEQLQAQALDPSVTLITQIDTDGNRNEQALKEIIKRLDENGIPVVLFIVPHSGAYIEAMPESYRASFNAIAGDLSKDVPVYNLFEKYASLPIWTDPIHVAISPVSAPYYSHDVAEIIETRLREGTE